MLTFAKISKVTDNFKYIYRDVIKQSKNTQDAEVVIFYDDFHELFRIGILEDYNKGLKTCTPLVSSYFKFLFTTAMHHPKNLYVNI